MVPRGTSIGATWVSKPPAANVEEDHAARPKSFKDRRQANLHRLEVAMRYVENHFPILVVSRVSNNHNVDQVEEGEALKFLLD